MIRVSAGIVTDREGRILIARRGEGRKNAHLWEFPGGKQEKGESAADALRRELLEELSLEIGEARLLCSREAQGLAFDFLTAEALSEPVMTEHEALAWARLCEMTGYDFCPADAGVAAALALNDPPVRAFLWDLDGTLMDTYPNMVACLKAALAEYGVETDAVQILNLMKENLGHALNTLAPEGKRDAVEARFRELENGVPAESVPAMPGVPDALRLVTELGGRNYLVTHRGALSWAYLRADSLEEYFSGGVTALDGLPRKPAPDMPMFVAERYGFTPENALMIGDRPLDTEAGRAAGMRTCLVDAENRFGDTPCTLRLRSCVELAELLRLAAEMK